MSSCTIQPNQDGKSAFLLLGCEIGLPEMEELKKIFQEALQTYPALALDASQVEVIRFPALQLIYSLWKTAQEKGREVFFIGEIPNVIEVLMQESGFNTLDWIQHRDLNHAPS